VGRLHHLLWQLLRLLVLLHWHCLLGHHSPHGLLLLLLIIVLGALVRTHVSLNKSLRRHVLLDVDGLVLMNWDLGLSRLHILLLVGVRLLLMKC
jgi:hypothetical protein